jgi:carboxynorspermidine decarboxylase
MEADRISQLDLSALRTPVYIIDEDALVRNLEILNSVRDKTGCRILLALKAYAAFSTFPLVRQYLDGVCASSPWEARLGAEEFKKQVHVFAPAYSDEDMQDLVKHADCIIFNSFSQWRKHGNAVPEHITCGMRINPEYSEVEINLYDPCVPHSRLGVISSNFQSDYLQGLSGLHFHTLCEQNADALDHTVEVIENRFGAFLHHMQWLNFGGGHHITRDDYDIDRLCRIILRIRETYGLDIYLEPGEAVALNAGVLVSSVLDVVDNNMKIAVLDTSADAHMPDVLAAPYRPPVAGAGKPGEHAHTFRLAGLTCLAGDVIGDYSFPDELREGSKIIFRDMAHYTMVKNTIFNGIRLPDIAVLKSGSDKPELIRRFRYEDYKNRLS